jgi:hypothetical protein
VLYFIFPFSILINYLWTSKYIEMGRIFGSPYHVDNYSFFWCFYWEPTNVPIVQVGLPLDFVPQFIHNVLLL